MRSMRKWDPGVNLNKNFFFFIIDEEAKWARLSVPGKLFHPSRIKVGKAKGLNKVGQLKGVPLVLALVLGIKLGWKGLPGTNALGSLGLVL